MHVDGDGRLGTVLSVLGWSTVMVVGMGAIVWGAELFAEHLAAASSRLGVSAFALALLLAGAEPEELATVATASARGVDGVAFGDVIGANAAVATLALAAGVCVTTMPFGQRVRRYGLGGLAAAVIAGIIAWDGTVTRSEGAILVAGYIAFIATIWIAERQPPSLGETSELNEERTGDGRVGRDLVLVITGLAALTSGSVVLVEGVRRLSGVEATQTKLGLTVVGFATAFELVVLAWSASRRGITDAVVAGVVGSYAYNLTMSLGAGALIAPIAVTEATNIRAPYIAMALLLALVLALSTRDQTLRRSHAPILLLGYAAFIATALLA